MIVVRKFLDFVFTKKELQVLDDILPEFKRKDRQDDEEALQQVRTPRVPLGRGRRMSERERMYVCACV